MESINNQIRQPLNLYSIFGYLLPGFFLTTLLIVDYDLSSILRLHDTNTPVKLETIKSLDLKVNYILDFFSSGTLSDFKFIPFLLFLLFCYLIGHIVSAFSSFVLERFMVKWTMGFPSNILVSGDQKVKWSWILGNYRMPLKSQMLKEIKDEVKNTFGFEVNKEDYYWLLYSFIITTRPYLAPRVHHFVNLYGFSRNVAATFILYIILRITFLNWVANSTMDWAVWAVMFLFTVSALFMFWNYLKLFKRQAIDIYYLFLSIQHDKDNILFKQ
ncbi:MAG: hypothetical protein ACI8Q1_003072 [Parvicella sp.]|jgi:hypothetical protein